VEQPPRFEDEEYHNHGYKLHKQLYGLKQAPSAWYKCLTDFLFENGFRIGKADYTLFTKKLAKIYLYAKYMLMISFLVLLMPHFVKNLARS
jgi:hypothetical protein